MLKDVSDFWALLESFPLSAAVDFLRQYGVARQKNLSHDEFVHAFTVLRKEGISLKNYITLRSYDFSLSSIVSLRDDKVSLSHVVLGLLLARPEFDKTSVFQRAKLTVSS